MKLQLEITIKSNADRKQYLTKDGAIKAIKEFLISQQFRNGFGDCNVIGTITKVKELK
jgi:hypothetical protein